MVSKFASSTVGQRLATSAAVESTTPAKRPIRAVRVEDDADMVRPYAATVSGVATLPPLRSPQRGVSGERLHDAGGPSASLTPEPRRVTAVHRGGGGAASSATDVVRPIVERLARAHFSGRDAVVLPSNEAPPDGLSEILDAVHATSSHIAATHAKQQQHERETGQPLATALASFAEHIRRYSHDTAAAAASTHVNALSLIIAEEIRNAAQEDEQRRSAAVPKGAAGAVAAKAGTTRGRLSRRSVAASLAALDQLLALLRLREPAQAANITRVRALVHLAIFAEAPVFESALDDVAGGGGAADLWHADGLPRLIAGDLPPAAAAQKRDDVMRPYLDAPPTFPESCASLLRHNATLKEERGHLLSRLRALSKSVQQLGRARCLQSLAKAFAGWRSEVRMSKFFGRFDSDVADRRKRIAEVEAALGSVSAKREMEKHALQRQLTLVSGELHTARMHSESANVISTKTKQENELLRAQVADLQRGAVLRLQQRIADLEIDLESWRATATAVAPDAAVNAWETFNRRRGQPYAIVVQSNAYQQGGSLMSPTSNARAAARRGGATGDISYPPLNASAAKAVALAEELAAPFVTLVMSMLAAASAVAEMNTGASSRRGGNGKAGPTKSKSIAASGSRAAQAARGANLHAVTADTGTHVMCLLHAVSPGHLPLVDVKRLAASEDPVAVGHRISGVCNDMGVPLDGIASTSLAHLTKPQLELIVAHIIARYSGVGAIASLNPPSPADIPVWCELVPSFSDTSFATSSADAAVHDVRSPMAALTRTGICTRVSTVAELQAHNASTAALLGRWKAWGTACVSDATAVAIAAADGAEAEPPLSAAEATHVAEFRVIPPHRFETYPVTLTTDLIDSLQTEVLSESCARALRRVFIYYASGGAGKVDSDSRMSVGEFESFIADSRLLTMRAGITKEMAVSLFREAARPEAPPSPGGPPQPPAPDSDPQVGPAGFIEFLVRCADAITRMASKGESLAFDATSAPEPSMSLTTATPVLDHVPDNTAFDAGAPGTTYPEAMLAALTTITSDFVICNCSGGANTDGVGRMMRSAQVTDLLNEHKSTLRKLFRVYAAADSTVSTSADVELQAKEYLKFIADANIITAVDLQHALANEGVAASPAGGKGAAAVVVASQQPLTEPTVPGLIAHQLYYRVLETTAASSSSSNNRDERSRGGLLFPAFGEVLCALAMCVSPSPFAAPHHKLRTLMEKYVLPLASAAPAAGTATLSRNATKGQLKAKIGGR